MIIRHFPEERLDEENYVLIQATSGMRFFQELNSKPKNVSMKLHEQVLSNHSLILSAAPR